MNSALRIPGPGTSAGGKLRGASRHVWSVRWKTSRRGATYTTAAYIALVRQARSGANANIFPWDMAKLVVASVRLDHPTKTAFRNALEERMDAVYAAKEVTHNFAFYDPSADTDGNGIPEGAPMVTFIVTTLDTRLPLQR